MDFNLTESTFDVLYIMHTIKERFSELNSFEISSLAYLALLLSVYDGLQTSVWGYKFAYNKYGGPTSSEILEGIEFLDDNKFINRVDSTSQYYALNKKGEFVVTKLTNLKRFEWRVKYLSTSIDSTLGKPFPRVINAIQNEPGLRYGKKTKHKLQLHNNPEKLYNYFELLRNVTDGDKEELWVPARIWIDYLISLTESDGGEKI